MQRKALFSLAVALALGCASNAFAQGGDLGRVTMRVLEDVSDIDAVVIEIGDDRPERGAVDADDRGGDAADDEATDDDEDRGEVEDADGDEHGEAEVEGHVEHDPGESTDDVAAEEAL